MPAAPAARRTPSIGGNSGSAAGANGETLPKTAPRSASVLVASAVRRGGGSVRGGLHRLLQLRIDHLDGGGVAEPGDHFLRLLLHELGHDRGLDLIEGRQRLIALLLDL